MPLVEGHADTRERWSGSFTTFSDKDRILRGEIPYVEAMFKSNADRLELRVREHIRSRGFGPWLTVATSPKGSYREADILNFLDRHLPALTEGRRWRIIFDDFSAHLTDAVFRLCWLRGYVLIPLGGGVTGTQQTVDLDLNLHVRREYCAMEAEALLAQMRDGIAVPSNRPEDCVDLLHRVMSKLAFHLAAADPYVKAGWKVNLVILTEISLSLGRLVRLRSRTESDVFAIEDANRRDQGRRSDPPEKETADCGAGADC